MRALAPTLLALVCLLVLPAAADGRRERIPWLTFNEVSLKGEGRVLSRHNFFADAAALSPDRRRFAYVRYTCDGCRKDRRLWLADVGSPRERVLVDVPIGITQVVWAPDGKALALTLYDNPDAHGLWIAHSDGTQLRRVAGGGGPQWSPDSKLLAFTEAGKVVVVFVESGDRRLSVPGSGPRWSPDGKYLAFTSGTYPNSSVSLVPLESGAVRVLGRGTEPLLWSPKGKYIAYTRDPSNPNCRAEVRIVAVATGRHRSIACGFVSSWSPDGRRIAFNRFAYSGNPLFVAPSQGGRARRLADEAWDPLWSPDSKWIAFTRAIRYCQSTLAVVRVDTGRTRRLVTPARLVTSLAWSAQGRKVLYQGERCSNQ